MLRKMTLWCRFEIFTLCLFYLFMNMLLKSMFVFICVDAGVTEEPKDSEEDIESMTGVNHTNHMMKT